MNLLLVQLVPIVPCLLHVAPWEEKSVFSSLYSLSPTIQNLEEQQVTGDLSPREERHPAYVFVGKNWTWHSTWGWKAKPLSFCLAWNDRMNCKNLKGKPEKLKQWKKKNNPDEKALSQSSPCLQTGLHMLCSVYPHTTGDRSRDIHLSSAGTAWQNLPRSTWKLVQPTPVRPHRLPPRGDFIALNKSISIALGIQERSEQAAPQSLSVFISYQLEHAPVPSLTTKPAVRLGGKSISNCNAIQLKSQN